jgi:hypothetical protein
MFTFAASVGEFFAFLRFFVESPTSEVSLAKKKAIFLGPHIFDFMGAVNDILRFIPETL